MPDYRMKWIRIWPHAWFDSSMRVELTNEERAFWVDLLALAGKSRFPGVVCSNRDGKGESGYPLTILCSLLVSWTPEQVSLILEKLEATQRITVCKRPLLTGEEGIVVRILNWSKWQSEAQRLQKYRKQTTAKRSTQQPSVVESPRTEVEVDVEGEVDSKSIVRQQAPDAPSFESFIDVYPRAEKKLDARRAWEKIPVEERGAVLAGLADWVQCDQWQDKQYIPLPATFLRAKQWNDTPIKFGDSRGKTVSANQQRARNTLEAARRAMARGSDSDASGVRPVLPHGDG